MKNKNGLTLIELLAVIAIIAILFVLLIPTINSAIDKARFTGLQTDMRSYEIAFKTLAMEGKSENLTEDVINSYLDESLKFENGLSKELNPFGIPYFFLHDMNFAKIYTVENKALPREYSIAYEFELDDLNLEQRGFDEIVYGVPYCDSPISIFGDFEYRTCHNKVTIMRYIGSSPSVAIPREIYGKEVIAINHSSSNWNSVDYINSFEYKNITDVVFPDTLKVIGYSSFFNNKLTHVDIPDSVVSIGAFAFGLNKIVEINVPPLVTSLERSVFEYNYLEEFRIPEHITSIGFDAFGYNPLEVVYLPIHLKESVGDGTYSFFDYYYPHDPLPVFKFY